MKPQVRTTHQASYLLLQSNTRMRLCTKLLSLRYNTVVVSQQVWTLLNVKRKIQETKEVLATETYWETQPNTSQVHRKRYVTEHGKGQLMSGWTMWMKLSKSHQPVVSLSVLRWFAGWYMWLRQT